MTQGVLAPVPASRGRAGEPHQRASTAVGFAPTELRVSYPAEQPVQQRRLFACARRQSSPPGISKVPGTRAQLSKYSCYVQLLIG